MTTTVPCTANPAVVERAIGADAADAVAATLKALADPLRLRMLSAIATAPDGEACVCDLAELGEVSQPTVSHHLKVLRDVGLLESERRGTWVWYRVAPAYRGAVTTLLDRFAPAALESRRHAGRASAMHGLADVERELEDLAGSLAQRIPGTTRDEALRVVRESYTSLARRGGIPVYLVALTEHFAYQRLTDAAKSRTAGSRTAGSRATAEHPPQVLFVCVGNAGRSQLAAALLEHYAGDRVVVRSAGSMPAANVHDTVKPLLAELDVDPDGATMFPKPLTDDAVRAADVVITMGCGDVCPVMAGKRYEDWVVGDPALASPAGARAIRDELDARVRTLVHDLLPDLQLTD
ncbi:metalloregulator ArsR/SmtB family transcription factor [Isoptericola variabilis]|uniref:Transcriptional regulator, ArsR family n=1 Tax=Isoptericola variabilis (strain 225) TaxID=743718 RepID=F6FS77_ISOV2|nr:metalloregulator ArsR/SmtB family transcription factor [Isoptericola variabilis]AEG43018.1 transcriptional regulator, ArsR family [Isoptericola variabilis 225]TWH30127.1 ArsR family transcriptional regulator [Isoptericola variabilis J7]